MGHGLLEQVRGVPGLGQGEDPGKVAARLEWHSKYAKNLDSLRIEAEAGRIRSGWTAYLELPELGYDEAYFERAFAELDSHRAPSYGGVGPILLTEIEAYMRLREINSPTARQEFVEIITSLDRKRRALINGASDASD